jgi:tryptophan synthase alpha chain
MNPIQKLFQAKRNNILSVYFTAGYPTLDATVPTLQALQTAGVDMVEVGIPFSDPIADGETIQLSSQKAIANGMKLSVLFEQLADIRQKVQIPLIAMGYLNPILQYGIEKFCADCAKVGINGVIVPDMPMQEYLDEYKPIFEQYNLLNTFLITPQTSDERIRLIDQASKGFIYMVSSASVTGAKQGISAEQVTYFERVRAMQLKNPTVIGFGISNKATFDTACQYANGAIIGSAFVKAVSTEGDLQQNIREFITGIR